MIAQTSDYQNDIFFTTSAWNLLRLSLIDGDMFLLPFCTPRVAADPIALPPNSSFLVPNHAIRMHPPGKACIEDPHRKDPPFPTTIDAALAARRELVKGLPEYAIACAKARSSVRADERWTSAERFVGDDIVVTTLGTGSALPSKHRNVSSTHLDIPGMGGILLDAGEGTVGQLRRRFGPDGVRNVYLQLKMVFISHMHADHHFGLQALLEDRFKVR